MAFSCLSLLSLKTLIIIDLLISSYADWNRPYSVRQKSNPYSFFTTF